MTVPFFAPLTALQAEKWSSDAELAATEIESRGATLAIRTFADGPTAEHPLSIQCADLTEVREFRDFFRGRLGACRPFWLPSYQRDLIPCGGTGLPINLSSYADLAASGFSKSGDSESLATVTLATPPVALTSTKAVKFVMSETPSTEFYSVTLSKTVSGLVAGQTYYALLSQYPLTAPRQFTVTSPMQRWSSFAYSLGVANGSGQVSFSIPLTLQISGTAGNSLVPVIEVYFDGFTIFEGCPNTSVIIPDNTTVFTVASRGYADYEFPDPLRRNLAFIFPDGEIIRKRVLSAGNNGVGTEAIVIDSVLGREFVQQRNSGICLCWYGRFRNDKLQLDWIKNDMILASVSMVELRDPPP